MGWRDVLGVPPKSLAPPLAQQLKSIGFNGFRAVERSRILASTSAAPALNKQEVHFTDRFPPGVTALRYAAGDVGLDGKVCSEPRISYFHPTSQDFSPITLSTHPADYPNRPAHESYLRFVTDLFYFVKYEQGKIVPAHKPQDYLTAGFDPRRYNPAGISEFLGNWGSILSFGLDATGMSSAQLFAHLQHCFSTMNPAVYLTMQTDFNISVFKVAHEDGFPVIFEDGPFAQALNPQNIPSYPGITAEDVNYHVVRVGKIGDGMKAPETDDKLVKFSASSRVVRGENHDGPSLLSVSWERGARVGNAHRQICDTLSLAIPYASKPNLLIRAPNFQAAKVVRSQLAKMGVHPKFLLDYNHRDAFGPHGKLGPDPDDFFIDMLSGHIPPADAGTSVIPVWLEAFKADLPKCAGYIALRKTPPTAVGAGDYHCFRFHSAHTFDVLVTSETSLSRSVGNAEARTVTLVTEPLLELKTPADLRRAQYADNRVKTVGLFNDVVFNVDKGLNLWYPVSQPPVKDAKKLKAEFESIVPPKPRRLVPAAVPPVQMGSQPQPSVPRVFSFGQPPAPSAVAASQTGPPLQLPASVAPAPYAPPPPPPIPSASASVRKQPVDMTGFFKADGGLQGGDGAYDDTFDPDAGDDVPEFN